MVIIRTSLFINCSTGLGHKTEKKYGICMCICSKFPVNCEASYNNNYCKSILFYAVRAGTEQEETVK